MADSRDDSADSALTWLLPLLTFLAGLVVAGAGFFLFGQDDEQGDVAAVERSPAPSAAASSSPIPNDLTVTVPVQCVRAAEAVEAVTRTLDDVVAAVQQLDAAELQRTLDVIQQLRPGVEQASGECLEIAAEGEIVTPPTPEPTPAVGPTPSS